MRERVFKIAKFIIMAMALGQLAISQIHIELITKLFVRDVGFFLFLFIISGLIVTFNLSAMNVENTGKMNQFIIASLAAVGSGIYFINLVVTDFITQDNLAIADIRVSLFFVVIAVVTYLVGAIIIVTSFFLTDKKEKLSHS